VLPSNLKGRQILDRFKERKPEPGAGYVDVSGSAQGPKWTPARHRPCGIRPKDWL